LLTAGHSHRRTSGGKAEAVLKGGLLEQSHDKLKFVGLGGGWKSVINRAAFGVRRMQNISVVNIY
jgi:hypothetical protein